MSIENFIVHPDADGTQETDADLIAVRFPGRRELLTSGQPMEDHPLFTSVGGKISAYFVEVKAGRCKLNGPWTNPERKNLQRVLYAMGFFPEAEVDQIAADQLYRTRQYETAEMRVQFVAIGSEQSRSRELRNTPQLMWDEILRWIHGRFVEYGRQKEHHPQWEGTGKQLFRAACGQYRNDPDGYVEHWLRAIQRNRS